MLRFSLLALTGACLFVMYLWYVGQFEFRHLDSVLTLCSVSVYFTGLSTCCPQ